MPQPSIYHTILAIMGLLYVTGTYGTPPILPGPLVLGWGHLIELGCAICLALRLPHVLYTVTRAFWLWLLIALELLSFLWSPAPEVSWRGNWEIVQTTLLGLFIASHFTLRQQVRLVVLAFGLGGFLSLLTIVAIPATGIHGEDHPGAWRGLYHYKNIFGSYMGFTALAAFLLARDRQKPEPWAWVVVIQSIILLLGSTSKTALVVSGIGFAVSSFCQNFRWQGKRAVIMIDLSILVGSSLGILLLTYWTELILSLGKDPTITGRTPLWGYVLARLGEHPWLGYGRGTFFAKGSRFAFEAGKAVTTADFIPPHAHNGFLELALEVGYVGLAVFLIGFAIAYGRSILQAYRGQNAGDLWPVACFTFIILNNITEAVLVSGVNLYWVYWIALSLSLPKLGNAKRRDLRADAPNPRPNQPPRREDPPHNPRQTSPRKTSTRRPPPKHDPERSQPTKRPTQRPPASTMASVQ